MEYCVQQQYAMEKGLFSYHSFKTWAALILSLPFFYLNIMSVRIVAGWNIHTVLYADTRTLTTNLRLPSP